MPDCLRRTRQTPRCPGPCSQYPSVGTGPELSARCLTEEIEEMVERLRLCYVATGQAHAPASYDRETHAPIRNMSRASVRRCSVTCAGVQDFANSVAGRSHSCPEWR